VILNSEEKLLQNIKNVLLSYLEEYLKIETNEALLNFLYRVLLNVEPYFEELFVETDAIFEAFWSEFFSLSKKNPSNLLTILDALQNNVIEKKIDYGRSNGVHFMTIHSAKGLQAPVVILIDKAESSILNKEKLAWFEDDNSTNFDLLGFSLLPPATLITQPAEKIRRRVADKIIDENRRLLYVAMTRAQDIFISVGTEKKESWHSMITEAMDGAEFVGAYDICDEAAEEKKQTELPKKLVVDLGGFIPQIVKNKDLHKDNDARIRGIIIHEVIEKMAKKYLKEEEIDEVIEGIAQKFMISPSIISKDKRNKIFELQNKEEFVFIRKGRAEVSLYYKGEVFRVDHLYLSGNNATVIEVKTSAEVPDSESKIPREYKEQMNNYYKIITEIFPGYRVNSYFLFTETASFLPFSSK
jgi:ATP-dependent helicase/nuclease subunit A